ncbi:hypothetical protein ScPMuIL_000203 [Solemya velum]
MSNTTSTVCVRFRFIRGRFGCIDLGFGNDIYTLHCHLRKGKHARVEMVVFTCSECGEALKKNQVEKHYLSRCRSCNLLSCVDCGKDFWGDEYKQHIKCITEEEKYSGKNYKPKPNANKGQVKQELWTRQVQDAVDRSGGNQRLKSTLERLTDYPNIPRKRPKFENFMKNSMNVHDGRIVDQVWELLMSKIHQDTDKINNGDCTNSVQSSESSIKENGENCGQEKDNQEKLNKRERKEERRKKAEKKEKKNKSKDIIETTEPCLDTEQRKKGGKKRKRDEENRVEAMEAKKLKQNDGEEEMVEDEEDCPRMKEKFDWGGVISSILKSKGEISMKKLKKKVLAEFAASGGTTHSEVKLWAKFNKKVTKNPNFRILKDRVQLIS